jgi:ubiquinone/menaquinone biosynthesis C-methylase UbiE
MPKPSEQKLEDYYTQTANGYDAAQIHTDDEHSYALMILRGILAEKGYRSLLDVGCGTGRAIDYLRRTELRLDLLGIEPVAALRQMAIAKGIRPEQLLIGNGYELPFADHSIDCVTAFGVLHHVEEPDRVIAEMLRVAKKAVFISDHNIYGWGNSPARLGKQLLRRLGFQTLKWVMTRGRGYHDTDYDGVFYPFSVFDHLPQIRHHACQVSLISTKNSPVSLYSQASHLAVLALLS